MCQIIIGAIVVNVFTTYMFKLHERRNNGVRIQLIEEEPKLLPYRG